MKTYKQWKGNLSSYLKPGDEIDYELYNYALNVLPPIYPQGIHSPIFQTGEAYDFNKKGQSTYMTYTKKDNKYYFLGIMSKSDALIIK